MYRVHGDKPAGTITVAVLGGPACAALSVLCWQARYRQRQREKMESLEDEVSRLKAQMALLRKANEALQQTGAEAGERRWATG